MKAGDKLLEGKELGNSLVTELGIEAASQILPEPLEMAIDKSGLGKMSKDMAKSSVLGAVEIAKYQANEKLVPNENSNQ